MFLVYHFTVIIWCFLTEGNRPLQQKLSLDGSPKPIHGTPERSDGLQWSAEQPCNPSKPKAKTSPVNPNAPAAHLEIKPDELAKKRGKVISFAQMIQHILHTQRSARMTELSKRCHLVNRDIREIAFLSVTHIDWKADVIPPVLIKGPRCLRGITSPFSAALWPFFSLQSRINSYHKFFPL